jgi:hypothetical protein
MKRLQPVFLLVLLLSCVTPGPTPPEPTPSVVRVSFVVCSPVPCTQGGDYVPNAQVAVAGGTTSTTNEFGYTDTMLKLGEYDVAVSAEQFHEQKLHMKVVGRMNQDVVLLAIAPPMTRVRTDGRFFAVDSGTFRPIWVSGLYVIPKTVEEQNAFIKWARSTGFNGFRVFAGELGQVGQTPDMARAILPELLERARLAGLYVYAVANTGSATGYDVPSHTREIARICSEHVNCVLEGANEYWHPSQSDQVNDSAWLQALLLQVVPANVTWSTGAADTDEGPDYPASAGRFATAHLDRGRDKWNQVRRLREIAGISEQTGKPAMSGEPIGADETSQPGRREADPNFFFAMGALCRVFELGCVFHSEQGLHALPHTGNQQRCAEAFLEGWRSLDTTDRLTFKNASWVDSPVKTFVGAVRVYSGVIDNRGYSVIVGAEPGLHIEWQNGWSQQGVIVDRGEVKVFRIQRGGTE